MRPGRETYSGVDTFPSQLLYLYQYIEDIYFFEVNTKYISSNVFKISLILQVRSTNEIADIFIIWDETFLVHVFTEKRNFSSYFTAKGKIIFFSSHFSLIFMGKPV